MAWIRGCMGGAPEKRGMLHGCHAVRLTQIRQERTAARLSLAKPIIAVDFPFRISKIRERCSAIAQSVEQMTVNHWVPGSSPGRGAKFKSPDASRGFFVSPPLDSHQGLRPRLFGPAGLTPSGPRWSAFGCAVESRSRSQIQKPCRKSGLFRFTPPGLSPGTASQVIRPCGPHPFGAALKRVRLRRRVQVAEPNSKALTQVGAFSFHPPWTLTRDCVPGYSALRASPLRGRAEARSAAPSRPGRGAKFKSPDANRGFFVSGSFEFWRLKPLLPLPHVKAGRPGRLFTPRTAYCTLSLLRLFSRTAVPMPVTSSSSSTVANGPWASRWAT